MWLLTMLWANYLKLGLGRFIDVINKKQFVSLDSVDCQSWDYQEEEFRAKKKNLAHDDLSILNKDPAMWCSVCSGLN